MKNAQELDYILGIDLGANSVGWAAVSCAPGAEATGILASGVRVFEAGVKGSMDRGREESNAAERRTARLQRRQTDRRRRRIGKVFNFLASHGLLPAARSLSERIAVIQALDRQLSSKHDDHVKLPYTLRRKALDESLEPHEVGRALLHLAQRRGFLSNRKDRRAKKDDQRGIVKEATDKLDADIKAADVRTLGEYLSQLDPAQTRIRSRYTHRRMYTEEFEKIWAVQSQAHPDLLTESVRAGLWQAIFSQRPLRDQTERIGDCELVPSEKRAPVWHPLAQRFRLLQEVNNLRLEEPSGMARPLDEEERSIAIERLEAGDLTLPEFRKLLGLGRSTSVNLDRGGKKALIGDRTSGKLRKIFLHRWDSMNPAEKLEAITDLQGPMSDDELREKAEQHWGLNGLQADEYAAAAGELEIGKYLSFSLKALEAMLPFMERGDSTTEAKAQAFPESTYRTELKPNLPPVCTQLKEIRNPAVTRTLTEMRRVVNELIRRFGKPREAHVELARDLKASRDEREERWKRMDQRGKQRTAAAEMIQRECGNARPSRNDVEKWLLAEECGWICPYSGRPISKTRLYDSGEVQVEHIIPYSRSLDDSFANLTLCYVSENARKGNRTPLEAYAEPSEREDILNRVRAFQGDFKRSKLRRFQMTAAEVSESLSNFSSRQLNDTRYASKLAARYVSCLYGGLTGEDREKRVFVSAGQVTSKLRRLWKIEGLLGDSPIKNRDDHRHHAIDAIVVALTSDAIIQRMASESARVWESGQRRLRDLPAPWAGFTADVCRAVVDIVVSWRCARKVAGEMHDATLLGEIMHPTEARKVGVKRKPVHLLSPTEVDAIIDPIVRDRVRLQIAALRGNIKHLEKEPPTMVSGVRIYKVRIAVDDRSRPLADGLRARRVIGGDYHHFEIVRRSLPHGAKIECVPISIQEAMARVKSKSPVVRRDHGAGAEFVCSIAKRDTFEITRKGGATERVVIQEFGCPDIIAIRAMTDARPKSKENRNPERRTARVLFEALKARKITVSPTGLLFPCNESPAARLR